MTRLRSVLAHILMACAITIIVVVRAVSVPIVLWLLPERERKEINNVRRLV